MSTESVPFEVESLGSDLSTLVRSSGVVRLEAEHLVLEYVTTVTDLGELGSGITIATDGSIARGGKQGGVQTARIPLAAVVSLRTTGGFWFAPRLHLEVSQMAALADVPWASGPRCVLKLRRADRQRARGLAVDLELRLADAQLRQLEG